MLLDALSLLRCPDPACRSSLSLSPDRPPTYRIEGPSNMLPNDIYRADIRCDRCNALYPVARGVPMLLSPDIQQAILSMHPSLDNVASRTPDA